MKIEIKRCTDSEMDLRITEGTVAFANAVRRVAMSQVPVFAIDSVVFYENASAFFDEYLANRLALVPLKTDPRYTEKDEVDFTLEVQGPCTVYSDALKSTDKKIVVANSKIPLLKLLDKQVLRLEAKAKLGIAKTHAKHQAGIVSYGYEPGKENCLDFRIESFGQLTTKQIMAKTLDLLEAKCDEFEEGIKEK